MENRHYPVITVRKRVGPCLAQFIRHPLDILFMLDATGCFQLCNQGLQVNTHNTLPASHVGSADMRPRRADVITMPLNGS